MSGNMGYPPMGGPPPYQRPPPFRPHYGPPPPMMGRPMYDPMMPYGMPSGHFPAQHGVYDRRPYEHGDRKRGRDDEGDQRPYKR